MNIEGEAIRGDAGRGATSMQEVMRDERLVPVTQVYICTYLPDKGTRRPQPRATMRYRQILAKQRMNVMGNEMLVPGILYIIYKRIGRYHAHHKIHNSTNPTMLARQSCFDPFPQTAAHPPA